jgi:phospholipase C
MRVAVTLCILLSARAARPAGWEMDGQMALALPAGDIHLPLLSPALRATAGKTLGKMTDGPRCAPAEGVVQHLIVVVQENHSFDSYFGRWCQAPAGSAPTCTETPGCCEAAPAGHAPVTLDDDENGAFDPPHTRACELSAMDDGRMDRYTKGGACSDPRTFAIADPDGPVASTLALAAQGAIADRYFQSGAAFLSTVRDAVRRSPLQDSTLLLIVYDESGGFFDHVAPPPASAADGQPYGPRVPLIALGKMVKPGYVSHRFMEHSAIVSYIAETFSLADPGGRANHELADAIRDLYAP